MRHRTSSKRAQDRVQPSVSRTDCNHSLVVLLDDDDNVCDVSLAVLKDDGSTTDAPVSCIGIGSSSQGSSSKYEELEQLERALLWIQMTAIGNFHVWLAETLEEQVEYIHSISEALAFAPYKCVPGLILFGSKRALGLIVDANVTRTIAGPRVSLMDSVPRLCTLRRRRTGTLPTSGSINCNKYVEVRPKAWSRLYFDSWRC